MTGAEGHQKAGRKRRRTVTAAVTLTLQSPRLCVYVCVRTRVCRCMSVFYISVGKRKIVSEISTFTLSSNIAHLRLLGLELFHLD